MIPKYQDEFQLQKQLNKTRINSTPTSKKCLWNFIYNISSAEKVALGLTHNKEYKFYDLYNSYLIKQLNN